MDWYKVAARHTFSLRRVQTVSGPTADSFLWKALEFLPTLPPAAAAAAVVLLLRPFAPDCWPLVCAAVDWCVVYHATLLSFPVNKFGVDLCLVFGI